MAQSVHSRHLIEAGKAGREAEAHMMPTVGQAVGLREIAGLPCPPVPEEATVWMLNLATDSDWHPRRSLKHQCPLLWSIQPGSLGKTCPEASKSVKDPGYGRGLCLRWGVGREG